MKAWVAGAAALVFGSAGAAWAQAWPTRHLTMVIPFAAGGPTDILGRVMAERMSEILGQQVVVENVAGAGGLTGSLRVSRAEPDGYTFMVGTVGSHAQLQTFYKRPPYDAATHFEPIALVAELPLILITRKDLPARNFQEFVALARAQPEKMNYGSAGAGSGTHLGCLLLNLALGTDIQHVPYRGTGPAMQDLQGGRIDFLCEAISAALPQIQGGTVKAIAAMTRNRSALLPDLPTIHESGIPEFDAYSWNALFIPKSVPAPIAAKLRDAALHAMRTPKVKERLEGLGAIVVSQDRQAPEYLAGFVSAEIKKWSGPIKATGITFD